MLTGFSQRLTVLTDHRPLPEADSAHCTCLCTRLSSRGTSTHSFTANGQRTGRRPVSPARVGCRRRRSGAAASEYAPGWSRDAWTLLAPSVIADAAPGHRRGQELVSRIDY